LAGCEERTTQGQAGYSMQQLHFALQQHGVGVTHPQNFVYFST
jgi:hypothetical protein